METKDWMKVVGGVLLFLVVVLGATWVIQGNDFFMYKVFGIRYENTRREIFEHSRAFNQGMVQELENMQFEYVKASEAHKAALADIILHRASGYNLDDPIVPSSLRQFVNKLKRERAEAK